MVNGRFWEFEGRAHDDAMSRYGEWINKNNNRYKQNWKFT